MNDETERLARTRTLAEQYSLELVEGEQTLAAFVAESIDCLRNINPRHRAVLEWEAQQAQPELPAGLELVADPDGAKLRQAIGMCFRAAGLNPAPAMDALGLSCTLEHVLLPWIEQLAQIVDPGAHRQAISEQTLARGLGGELPPVAHAVVLAIPDPAPAEPIILRPDPAAAGAGSAQGGPA